MTSKTVMFICAAAALFLVLWMAIILTVLIAGDSLFGLAVERALDTPPGA
jgi:hypothetical protein